MLELKGVTKHFRKQIAVEDVRLSILEHEFLVILGKSGAGKTTLLRIMAGLQAADSGSVWMNACDVTRQPPAERKIAYVTQEYALYPQLTVHGNLVAALNPLRLPKAEVVRRIAEVSGWFQIESLAARLPSQLSGGQAQRVAFAKAVVRQPSLLLVDEPLSQLDCELRGELRRLLQTLNQRFSTTTVMVTHDPVDALSLADRIAVMEEGHLVQIGTPDDVYRSPESPSVAGLLSPWGVNWLPVESLMVFPAFEQILSSRKTDPQGITTVGIRPEAIQCTQSQAAPIMNLLEFAVEIGEIRNLGFSQLVHAQLGTHRLQFLADRNASVRPGRVSVQVAKADVLLFP